MAMSEDVKRRQADRRFAKRKVDRLLVEIVSGRYALPRLRTLIENSDASLIQKEEAIAHCIQAGHIAKSDFVTPLTKPTREDFGLAERECFPPYEWIFDNYLKFLLIGGALLSILCLLFFGGYPFKEAFVLGLLCSPIGAGVILLAAAHPLIVKEKINRTRSRREQYLDRVERYKTVVAALPVIEKASSTRRFHEASGPEFEVLVGRVFKQWGYQVTQVGGASDGGVDLVVRKGCEHALIQCKAHAKPCSPAVVRELYGALNHSEGNYAYLATLHGVTAAAAEWLKDKPIAVLKADDLTGAVMPARVVAARDRVVG